MAAEAARVRDQVRGRAAGAPQTPPLTAEAAVEQLLSTLPEVLRAAMREQVETLVAQLGTAALSDLVGTAVGTNGNGPESS